MPRCARGEKRPADVIRADIMVPKIATGEIVDLTAISTLLIALMVAVIAFAQWRTARQRMILDLFQRRMDLIDLVSTAASTILIQGALRNENVDGFLRARRGDNFLFGPEVTTLTCLDSSDQR
jgi:hypothetical protein